jgi:hypothetical protein
MVFREIIAVYSENYEKLTNKLCEKSAKLFNAEGGGIYNKKCDFTGKMKDNRTIDIFRYYRFI